MKNRVVAAVILGAVYAAALFGARCLLFYGTPIARVDIFMAAWTGFMCGALAIKATDDK